MKKFFLIGVFFIGITVSFLFVNNCYATEFPDFDYLSNFEKNFNFDFDKLKEIKEEKKEKLSLIIDEIDQKIEDLNDKFEEKSDELKVKLEDLKKEIDELKGKSKEDIYSEIKDGIDEKVDELDKKVEDKKEEISDKIKENKEQKENALSNFFKKLLNNKDENNNTDEDIDTDAGDSTLDGKSSILTSNAENALSSQSISNPKTGDSILVYVLIMLAAIIGMAVILIFVLKKESDNN